MSFEIYVTTSTVIMGASLMKRWKKPLLFITGAGISNLGDWIYLIAINILVLDLTKSPMAMAGLYIIRPLAILLTNSWIGGWIDRSDKRSLMIQIDILRGILVACIPFLSSIWWIYTFLFLLGILSSAFTPASNTYITKFVPIEQRKQFNAYYSFTTSGAFLLGPSIAGFLIAFTNVDVCIFINAISFILSAMILYFLPKVDQEINDEIKESSSYWKIVIEDWKTVFRFGKVSTYFLLVFFLFQITMLIAFAIDSQEATFIREVLKFSKENYGIMVSMGGVGYLAGSLVVSVTIRKISLPTAIGFGTILMSLGYLMFYLSTNFISAAIGFIILGFFLSFANTGYTTFYQNNVPVEIMGRFSSASQLFQGVLGIILTLILGGLAELISLRTVAIIFSAVAIIISIALCIVNFNPAKKKYYETRTDPSPT